MSSVHTFFHRFCSLVFILSLPGGVFAEPPVEVLPETVISSTRLPGDPVDIRTLPTKVTVITADEMQRSGAKTIQEAIQGATGIVMYDSVGNAFQQTIDLRGFNGAPVPATSVFVDGVRVNEPDFNSINFDLIPLETIERIEIIPGASAIYGKNALGGAINIITKRGGSQSQVTADTLFGSFHRERYNINASGPVGKLDYFGSLTQESERGFRDKSDADIGRYFGKIGYRPAEGTDVSLAYTSVKDHLLQAGSLPLSVAAIDRKRNFTPGDFFDSSLNLLNLQGRQTLPLGFSLNLNGFYRRLLQEQFGVGQPILVGGVSSIGRTLSETESRGGVVQLLHDASPLGHRNNLVIGGEFTRNDIGSRLSSTSDFGPFANRKDTNERVWGFYVQDTLNLTASLILTAGLRYDIDKIDTDFEDTFTPPGTGTKTFSRVTPRAGLTYLITSGTSAFFNYTEGFRVPTTDELFSIVGASNAFLNPVHSRNYEVGVRSKLGGRAQGAVALFRSDVRNEIFFTCNLVCDPFSFAFDGLNRNIDKSRRQGIEATVKAKLASQLDGLVNYTYTEAQFLSSVNLSATKRIDPGDSFPLVPKHRLSVTGNYHPLPDWTLSLSGLYVSTQFFLNDEPNSQPRLPGYFVAKARVAYERTVPGGRLSAFLLFDNILDGKYFTQGIIATNIVTGGGAVERFVVPAPGIAIFGGLSYRFEGF